jgi:hypothetical protein
MAKLAAQFGPEAPKGWFALNASGGKAMAYPAMLNKAMLYHVGTHPLMLEYLLADDRVLARQIMAMQAGWRTCVRPDKPFPDHVVVAMVCRNGKHRSMAWSHIWATYFNAIGFKARVWLPPFLDLSATCQGQGEPFCQACGKVWPVDRLHRVVLRLSQVHAEHSLYSEEMAMLSHLELPEVGEQDVAGHGWTSPP